MLDNHFAKIRSKNLSNRINPLESLLYNLISHRKLYTKEDVVKTYEEYCHDKPDEVRGFTRRQTDIFAAVESLAKSNLLREIVGVRLDKLL
jgi:hypothetical protein